MSRPHIEPYVDTSVEFRRLTLPGFPRGTHYKTLSVDPANGACSLVVRFESGWRRPAGFSWTEMEFMLLAGEMRFGERIVRPGHYLWVPAGVSLPPMEVSRDARALLFYNYGEPSFEPSAEDHDEASRAGLVELNAYDDLQWVAGTRMPAVAPGCFVKILRLDPLTKAYTFLYCMTPNFWQDNISYHDCAEESYHIWGTSWMMQFGELPTGGYFWRPPYINHGAFASQLGCIALGRTDSELYNWFHHNPWSTPAENASRAAARLQRERPDLFKWIDTRGHNHPVDFEHPHGHAHGGAPHHHGDGNTGHRHTRRRRRR